MVYVFDPTTCEEPKKPTYRYSPIPKTVKHCCCPKPTEEEADKTENIPVDKVETTPVDREPTEVGDKTEDNNNEAPNTPAPTPIESNLLGL